jgi:hypothetical protein
VAKILDARYNEQEIFHELLVTWNGFLVGEASCEPYSVLAVNITEIVAKFMEHQNETIMVRKRQCLSEFSLE